MIVRRYGSSVLSVVPNFDSRAMTEIGFNRDGRLTIPTEEFQRTYERAQGHELTAQAEGTVQGDVEEAVLASLSEQLHRLAGELKPEELLLIENEPGVDQAKTRGTQTTTVEAGENRLRFGYVVDPPLKVGVYRRREG
jgi:hypothetical protein